MHTNKDVIFSISFNENDANNNVECWRDRQSQEYDNLSDEEMDYLADRLSLYRDEITSRINEIIDDEVYNILNSRSKTEKGS